MLFKKTETIREYAELGEINLVSVTPTLRNVEDLHIVPLLGKELYRLLDAAVKATVDEFSLDDRFKTLLHQCRMIIGPYLAYYYQPKAEIKLTDAGARREETANSKTAYQYQGTNFREANLREAESTTELLLEFLEENKTTYPEWVASAAFKKYRSLFIKSGKEFDEFFSSHTPYRNFWAMRHKMVDVEQTIRETIGDELLEALKAKDLAGTFTDKDNQLMFRLKKAIAYHTVALSVPYLRVKLDSNGVTVISSTPSAKEGEVRTSAPDPVASGIIINAQDAGQTWLNRAVKYLTDNPTHFPLFVIASSSPSGDAGSNNNELGGAFGMC